MVDVDHRRRPEVRHYRRRDHHALHDDDGAGLHQVDLVVPVHEEVVADEGLGFAEDHDSDRDEGRDSDRDEVHDCLGDYLGVDDHRAGADRCVAVVADGCDRPGADGCPADVDWRGNPDGALGATVVT